MKVWSVIADVAVLVLAETEEDACRIAASYAEEAIIDDVRDEMTWTAFDAARGTRGSVDKYAPYCDPGANPEHLSAGQWMDRLGQKKEGA